MKLVLVRHGISSDQWDRVVDGDNDPELSKVGVDGVERIAPYVDENQFDLVFASTLARAIETAKILTKGNCQIHQDSRLVELRMGQWKNSDAEQLANKVAFDSLKCVKSNYINYANNAESFDQIKQRCDSFVAALLKKYPDKTILVASHGIAIRALVSTILKIDMDKVMNVNNVSFTEFLFDKEKDYSPRLMSFNSKYPLFYGRKGL